MIDYAIHRMSFNEVANVYPDFKMDKALIPTYIYMAFWDELYAGYMAGSFVNMDTIEIQATQLVPERRGKQTARAVREMIKAVHKDFHNIFVDVINTNSDMLRILIGVGFRVIGSRFSDGDLFVKLEKQGEYI